MGKYDVCLDTKVRNDEGEIAFTGRYCTVVLYFNGTNVGTTMNSLLPYLRAQPYSHQYESPDEESRRGLDWGRRFGSVGGPGFPKHTILSAAECWSSWKSIFVKDTKESDKYLSCLHGIRAIAASQVLWAHVYCLNDPRNFYNTLSLLDWESRDRSSTILLAKSYVVDTFFCLSGAMALRSSLRTLQKGKIMTAVSADLIIRWIRLAVPSIAAQGVAVLTLHYTTGPFKDIISEHVSDRCSSIWGAAFLLENTKHFEDACLMQLWYVAVDYQLRVLFLIPLIAIASHSNRRVLGFSLLSTMLLVSIFYVAIITYVYRLPPIFIITPKFLPVGLTYFYKIVISPMSHMASFAVGVCLMNFIEEQRSGRMRKFPRAVIILLWITAIIIGLMIISVPFQWQSGGDPETWGNILFSGFGRTLWCIALSSIIYCCAMGHGGPVNWVLSLRVFIPISRLSFAFYLLHCIVLGRLYASRRELIEADHFSFAVTTGGIGIISLIWSFIFFALIESPLSNIVPLFLKSKLVSPRRSL
ncbi:nose resistant to fluoxetine protein 6 [Galendromus occidentalis]|uniref:Nose resistant to fluoxetine protein 6 n=1 Tax=Galendromus occidentalis TaxID=34638 RepID=A0AAJ7SF78_9ACAR|nr:nose resistant to fluoxetine protein 6 [Galendromus occidentalis]